MAHILIDGYNLIGIAHEDLEKARNDLIENLQRYARLKDHQITLVFDGWKEGKKDESKIKTANVTIIFSRLGETADLLIKRILKTTTIPWIVVTSDREISNYAVKKKFAVVASGEFNSKFYSTLRNSGDGSSLDSSIDNEMFMKDEEDDVYYSPARFKGNPRKLSKKDRRNLQALRKL